MLEIYTTIVISLAFLGEALFGFGGGMVAVPLLSLIMEVRDAVLITSVFQLLIGVLVFRNFLLIPWKVVNPVTVGVIVGVPLGVYSLSCLDLNVLRWLLAIFILAFLARVHWFPNLAVRSPSVIIGATSGMLSGFFQGSIGTGGPNLIVYLSNICGSRLKFRAALIYLFSVANVIRIAQVSASGLFSWNILRLALITLPFFLAGIIWGQKQHSSIFAGNIC